MKKLLLIITFACVQAVWCAEDIVTNDLISDVDEKVPLYDDGSEHK